MLNSELSISINKATDHQWYLRYFKKNTFPTSWDSEIFIQVQTNRIHLLNPGSGRPTKITNKIMAIVEETMHEDDETTAHQLHWILTSKGYQISRKTILHWGGHFEAVHIANCFASLTRWNTCIGQSSTWMTTSTMLYGQMNAPCS